VKTGKVLLLLGLALVGLVGASVPFAERYTADRIKAALESDGRSTVGAVEVNLLSRSLTLTDVAVRRAVELTAKRWHAAGLAWPLAELLKGHFPLTGWHLGDPLLADRVEVDDLRIADPGSGGWHIGLLRFDDLDLARFDADVTDASSPAIALGARLLQALSARRLEEKDIAFTAVSGDRFAFTSVVLEDVELGKVGSLALQGLRFGEAAGREPTFTLAELQGKGLDLHRPLASMSAEWWLPGAPLGRIGLDQASVTGFGGAAMKRYGIALDSITHETTREGSDVRRSRSRVSGFVLAPPLRGLEALQLRLIMETMGLREARLEFECLGADDRTRQEITIERCALTGRDLGEIALSLTLVGADQAFWQAIDEGDGLLLLGTNIALSSARLVLADRSLLDRSLRALAAASGQPAAVMRAETAREIRRYQPPDVLITADLTKLLDTVARFIEQGGTLTVEAKPDPPFGIDKLDYLMSPGPDLVSLLGVTATLAR